MLMFGPDAAMHQPPKRVPWIKCASTFGPTNIRISGVYGDKITKSIESHWWVD
jgi:hypothetical protein